MPSVSTNSSSVLGRWTGKKTVVENYQEGTFSAPWTSSTESEKRSNGHRRDSSILSLSNVADLGNNVRRSISLRSHRSQPSASSLGHTRYPSTGGNHFGPAVNVAPIEETGLSVPPDIPLPPTPPSQISPPRSVSRGKLSISRGLTSRFRSTDNLPTLSNTPPPLDGTSERPTTAVEIRKVPSTSSMLSAPAVPKRAPPDKPPLQSQSSFLRESQQAGVTNGIHIQPSTSLTPGPPNYHPKAIYQQIHETSAKRMATIAYLRTLHAGHTFHFNTLHYTSSTLSATIPSLAPLKASRRATNYFILGYSLPLLHDHASTSTPLDYLRAFASLLSEFESYQSLSGFDSNGNSLSRGRVGQIFKSAGLVRTGMKTRRSSTVTDTTNNSSSWSADYLNLGRSTSTSLDPTTTSPQDTTSPLSPNSGSSTAPLNFSFHYLLTPHLPFDPDFNTTFATLCDTLIETYGKILELVAAPEVCSVAVGEVFGKADKAVRKILVGGVVREFEEVTRAGVRGEVAGLGRLVLGGLA